MLNKQGKAVLEEGTQKVTEKDVAIVVSRSEEIQKKFSARGPLARFIVDGKLLISLVKDYWSKSYRQIPYGILSSAVFTLIYVFNPLDIVPDVLPIIGQVDDVAVLSACLLLIEQDLNKYRDWKAGQD
ncbi:MAG: DUF1232 domain-containing protein [Chloroflexi bacterium]|nr:DUF1232 domain-containing protein [Chloroflexota bacterium]